MPKIIEGVYRVMESISTEDPQLPLQAEVPLPGLPPLRPSSHQKRETWREFIQRLREEHRARRE